MNNTKIDQDVNFDVNEKISDGIFSDNNINQDTATKPEDNYKAAGKGLDDLYDSYDKNRKGWFYGTLQHFNKIRISLSSPDLIRQNSFGEVKKPETVNYRTLKTEKDGLFCQKIFGPVTDYECACGKYKRIRYSGHVCEKCGTEVTKASARRQRMAHIELACPIAHIWYFKSFGNKISYIIDIPASHVESIINFEQYVTIDPGMSNLSFKDIVPSADVEYHTSKGAILMTGSEAIQKLLKSINLKLEYELLQEQYKNTKAVAKKSRMIKRMQILAMFINSGSKPEHMILEVLPVLPPELRPLVSLDGGKLAVSDLNDLYRRIINRNNRLKRIQALNAPEVIIINEKRMLQESVNALFDNTKLAKPALSNSTKRPFKSLSDLLKGKTGRFRQNLLGKRVDYSGRSVIVVGPELKLHQCGIPKYIALELFKPHVYGALERKGIASSIRVAKYIIESEVQEVWDILEEVIKDYLVLLNRAPTLHRLGIQAFTPLLTEGKAIRLHPLTCSAFNADFDGDQMAVHLPLSCQAQAEARELMLSSKNILTPASGDLTVVPTKDIVLGIYYMSMNPTKQVEDKDMPVFSKSSIVRSLVDLKYIHIHDPVYYIVNRNGKSEKILTTAGRILVYDAIIPEVPFEKVNKVLDKSGQKDLIDAVYDLAGHEKTVEIADSLMQLGFKNATASGISLSKDDMIAPSTGPSVIKDSELEAISIEKQFEDGLITSFERYNRIVDLWSNSTEKITDTLMDEISKDQAGFNSLFIMADSGARGSREQLRQLCGIRGLMAKPSGEIILNPIKTNFRAGLTTYDYFNSTHGARKGMADTALKTANAGYLTRRLVNVAQDITISEHDCGTSDFIEISSIMSNDNLIMDYSESLFGRCLAEDLYDIDGQLVAKNGDIVNNVLLKIIQDKVAKTEFKVRSPISCDSDAGICAKCYGIDLSTRSSLVSLGTAIGIIAAQSIGEPGTQLTMRTFHMGGAASKDVEKDSIISIYEGKLVLKDYKSIDKDGYSISISRNTLVSIILNNGIEKVLGSVPYGSKVLFKNGDKILEQDVIAKWDAYSIPLISEISGKVVYKDMIDGISISYVHDEITGNTTKKSIDWRRVKSLGSEFTPSIMIESSTGETKSYFITIGASIEVEEGQQIEAGHVLSKISKLESKTKDITGGLPRIIDLFEARKTKNAAVMSPIAGTVSFNDSGKFNKKIIITPENQDEPCVEIIVSKGKNILIQEGESIKKGQLIIDALPDLQDILEILGFDKLINYLIGEVQTVYRSQGVKIHSKHIECIARQMSRKVLILDSGDSESYIIGSVIHKDKAKKENALLASQDKETMKFKYVLQGITKASLQTDSWISAASFQETTRILIDSAISRKVDNLVGVKENVATGRLIPAGAGFIMRKEIENFEQSKKIDIQDNFKNSQDIVQDIIQDNTISEQEIIADQA